MSTCASCKHLFAGDRHPNCRRYPPTVSVLIVPRQSIATGGGLVPMEETRSSFPIVKPDWTCGEYAAKLEVAS